MISVYTDADYLAAYQQKRRIFYAFLAVTLAYCSLAVGLVIYHSSLPYADAGQALPRVLVYVLSALYVMFLFPFLAIKYSRSRRYCKMLGHVSESLKMEEENYFYCFREKSQQKDNIDVVGCVFETWSKKKQEWLEREAYFDPEKPLPNIESGDLVAYITQSNFIIQYHIVEKQALEFEEEDEEDEASEEHEEREKDEETQTQGEAEQ